MSRHVSVPPAPAMAAAAFVLIALAVGIFAYRTVQANPHTGQSVDVVICCGAELDEAANVVNGGELPFAGPAGDLGDFNFSFIEVADVSAASLAAFDTFVLNVASEGLNCNISQLSAAQKANIVSFAGAGNKLIIYDSECTPPGGVDYSWLPFPFTTDNPGAAGAQGTVTIVEENTLSTTNPADPHYIDAVDLGENTDAIGDMNVMVTLDPNWCLDMSGTNRNQVTGPVHTYARFGSVGSVGLMIYNGMDLDEMNEEDPDWLKKIWLQELQQPFNPDGLPCAVPVAGISLTPEIATNEIGSDHTVTAHITDLFGDPSPDVEVTFEVTDGPNAGETGVGTTDANGEATFTYTGAGGAGTDTIEACFTPEQPAPEGITDLQQQEQACDTATKTWVEPEATATPTPTPTPTPPVLEVQELPRLGGSPSDGGLPWLAIAVGLVAISAGGLALAHRSRRTR